MANGWTEGAPALRRRKKEEGGNQLDRRRRKVGQVIYHEATSQALPKVKRCQGRSCSEKGGGGTLRQRVQKRKNKVLRPIRQQLKLLSTSSEKTEGNRSRKFHRRTGDTGKEKEGESLYRRLRERERKTPNLLIIKREEDTSAIR